MLSRPISWTIKVDKILTIGEPRYRDISHGQLGQIDKLLIGAIFRVGYGVGTEF